MRNLGVLSVLLLGVSAIAAQAGNYVPQQNYGGSDVVVNMDVMATGANQGGYGNAPVLQAPLQQPILQQPLQAPLPPLHPPIVLRRPSLNPPQNSPQNIPMTQAAPSYPSYYSSAPTPLPLPSQQEPIPPLPPAPIASVPDVSPPSQQQSQQQAVTSVSQLPPPPSASPIWDTPEVAPVPAPVSMNAPQPVAPAMPAPPPITQTETVPVIPSVAMAQPSAQAPEEIPSDIPPQPFSTRELAASAPPMDLTPKAIPATGAAPSPVPPVPLASAHPEPMLQAAKTPDITPDVTPINDTLVKAPEKAPEKTSEKIAAKKPEKASYAEAPMSDDNPAPKTADAVNPARELLAQAREQAGTEADGQERKVVLFDKAPPAPSAKAPLSDTDATNDTSAPVSPVMKSASATDILKPTPLPMPADDLKAPANTTPEPKVSENTAPPQALPAPVASNAPESALETAPDNAAQVAMLTPKALPDVAPSSIPTNSAAVKKAETVVDDFEAYRLLFDRTSAELKPTEREVLDSIIGKLKRDENIKLQLRAYAAGTPDTTTQARRLSLSRALAVRSYLIGAGITSSRLDVRALGMGTPAMGDVATRADIPADRVDMIFTR